MLPVLLPPLLLSYSNCIFSFTGKLSIRTPELSSCLTASTEKDTLDFWKIQHDKDRPYFEQDMCHEMNDLVSTSTVEIFPCSSVPDENKPLQSIWSFRRKRTLDWSVIKHRSRVCPHGGMQIECINFWETYALFISWLTVHLTLILSLLLGLKGRQVDYVSAYTQAPLDFELFMNIPPGLIVQDNKLVFTRSSTKGKSSDYVLKIK